MENEENKAPEAASGLNDGLGVSEELWKERCRTLRNTLLNVEIERDRYKEALNLIRFSGYDVVARIAQDALDA